MKRTKQSKAIVNADPAKKPRRKSARTLQGETRVALLKELKPEPPCDPTDLLDELQSALTSAKMSEVGEGKNEMKKPKESQPIAQPDSVRAKTPKTPFVTVDLDSGKWKQRKLPKFSTVNDLSAYARKLSTEELVEAVVLIGNTVKNFSDWFHDHAEYICELRSRLPRRGPNAIAVVCNGRTEVYLWSEFCRDFLGVSNEWVRQLMLSRFVNPEDDAVPQPKKKKEPKPDSADRKVVSQLSWETLEHKAQTFELRYSQVLNELHMLLKQIEKASDKLPTRLRAYAEEAKKRCLTLFDVEPPAPGGLLKLEPDELDAGAPVIDKKKGAN